MNRPILNKATEHLLRAAVALIVCAGLFLLMPAAHHLFRSPLDQAATLGQSVQVVIERVQEKPQPRSTPLRPMRSIAERGSNSQSRAFDLKFSPDLGVGGGSGAAVSAQNLENMVFEEGQVDQKPVALTKSAIPYPQRAREAGIEGVVEMILRIDRQGRVIKVDFIRVPHALFKNPVQQAVMQWLFTPARKQGVPVTVMVHQSVQFKLER